MASVNRVFWAKKQDRKGRYEWLPLSQHLEDTRQIAGLLWEHWLSEGQKEQVRQLFDQNGEERGKALVQFLGAIHDLGKATPAFQIKSGFVNSPDLDRFLIEKLEGAGFRGIGSLELASISSSPHALAGQKLLTLYGVSDGIAAIIGAHHGKPVDEKRTVAEQSSYDSNYYQSDNQKEEVYGAWQQAQHMIFQWALHETGFDSVNDLPKIPQPVQVILSGLLIMADWIASNEKFFPLIPAEVSEIEQPDLRAQSGWEQWKRSDLWQPSSNQEISVRYEDRFGFSPRDVQRVFSEVIDSTADPGIFILEAPMGIGKTEAAFMAVEQLAEKTGRSGMFFGLPTQATSNGIFPRVRQWLERVEEEAFEKASLRLAHGKSSLNEEFSSLATNISPDDERDASVIVNDWFGGRKTSALDDFVVGTVDQFLLVALKQKHLALRHLGFSKKVVVIDEVHAYDAYMNQYLTKAIRWMAAYGVPIVILSATLPAERREEMIRSYLLGKGVPSREIRSQLSGLKQTAYPLITYTDHHTVLQACEFEPGEEKTVRIVRESSAGLFNRLDEWMQSPGVIGVIVNTVRRAQELAKACALRYGEDRVELLHSRFIDTDRAEKERNLLRMIGKGAERPESKIIVGTQVMEQSLDIDFDVLATDLAPMDLLIQRIGRLHRHDIPRPFSHEAPVCYVLDTDDELDFEQGSLAVYGGYLLLRTQSLLPEQLMLPGDISVLVQKVYGNEPVPLEEHLLSACEEMKKEHEDKIDTKKANAKVYRIAPPVLKKSFGTSDSLIGWLQNKTPVETEERVYAQVRDIQETIEVIALQKVGHGYGIIGENDDLSGCVQDAETARTMARQTIRLPNTLSAHYAIEATIRELEAFHADHFANWQEQPWLKGALGIIFDENCEFELNGVHMRYDRKYGLTDERM